MIDTNQTLEELNQEEWGEPEFRSSLVKRVHRLVKMPLKEMSAEDMRVLISQKISLEVILPLAFNALKEDPLAEGDFYPGDLLHAVCSVSGEKEFKVIGENIFEIIRHATDAEHRKEDESVLRECAAMIPSIYIKTSANQSGDDNSE